MTVTTSNKKQTHFAIRCKATSLYLGDFTPSRASIEVTPVPAVAMHFETRGKAVAAAEGLAPLFGSFDWQPVPVSA